MRIGIIDLGTNSVRFDVHQIGPKAKARTLHREKIMVRLGQGVFINGRLDPNAVQRTIHAFSIFKKISAQLLVSKVIALGTSALREAADSGRFVAKIKKSTGFDVHVITGSEEARLIALGILGNEKVGKKKFGLIDIGGGSTEISICQERKAIHSESFQLGTARLQQVFLKKSPPAGHSIDELRRYIRGTLHTKMVEQAWPRVTQLIGSSGTIKALTKIVKKTSGGKTIEFDALSKLVKTMSKMNTTQLLEIAGMEAKRVDMILAGAILLEEAMKTLHAKSVVPSDYSLRDGILQEQIDLSNQHLSSQIAFHIPDLYDKAVRLNSDVKHLKKTVQVADRIFARLQSLHKIKTDASVYLSAATILRNVGESVSLIGHQEHSYYVVKNADFPFVENWEAELVAQLCRYHERTKLDPAKTPFAGDAVKLQLFMKLWTMLALVDALDAVPQNSTLGKPLIIEKVTIGKKNVKIIFSGGTLTDLEVYRVEQKKNLFKEVFKRTLEVERV